MHWLLVQVLAGAHLTTCIGSNRTIPCLQRYDMHCTRTNLTNLEPSDASIQSMRCARTYPRIIQPFSGVSEEVSLEGRFQTGCSEPHVDVIGKRPIFRGERRYLTQKWGDDVLLQCVAEFITQLTVISSTPTILYYNMLCSWRANHSLPNFRSAHFVPTTLPNR